MRFNVEGFAMMMLDKQYGYINFDADGKVVNDNQNLIRAAYYEGLRTALEVVLSDAYEKDVGIEQDNGEHHIVDNGEDLDGFDTAINRAAMMLQVKG